MSQSVSQNPEVAAEEDLELPEEVEVPEEIEAPDEAAELVEAADLAETDEEAAPEVVPTVVLPIAVDRPVQTVGRRKEAVVRIRLVPGNGTFTLNGRSLDSYFPNKVHQQLIKEPLVILEKAEIYNVIARLHGGGVTGQAGALRLAIARALIELDETDRPPLKKAGFLTRDARATERKKYGLKKARKAPQYSKR
jgi:small subunit ribosomal protein S9